MGETKKDRGCVGEWLAAQMGGWMDGSVDRWVGGMNGWISVYNRYSS